MKNGVNRSLQFVKAKRKLRHEMIPLVTHVRSACDPAPDPRRSGASFLFVSFRDSFARLESSVKEATRKEREKGGQSNKTESKGYA